MELMTGLIILVISLFLMRVVLSVEKFLLYLSYIIRLLIGIGKKLEIDEKYIPSWNEVSDAYPEKPKS